MTEEEAEKNEEFGLESGSLLQCKTKPVRRFSFRSIQMANSENSDKRKNLAQLQKA